MLASSGRDETAGPPRGGGGASGISRQCSRLRVPPGGLGVRHIEPIRLVALVVGAVLVAAEPLLSPGSAAAPGADHLLLIADRAD
jgi:hypothetical protein